MIIEFQDKAILFILNYFFTSYMLLILIYNSKSPSYVKDIHLPLSFPHKYIYMLKYYIYIYIHKYIYTKIALYYLPSLHKYDSFHQQISAHTTDTDSVVNWIHGKSGEKIVVFTPVANWFVVHYYEIQGSHS